MKRQHPLYSYIYKMSNSRVYSIPTPSYRLIGDKTPRRSKRLAEKARLAAIQREKALDERIATFTAMNNERASRQANKATEGWLCAKGQREYTAPAGTYYIGDLCYALPRDVYEKVFGGVGGYQSGFYFKGADFFMMAGTSYGDGEYKGSDGNSFCVDAGIIGIAPVRICDMKGQNHIPGGHIYTFSRPVNCRFGGGVFDFYEDGYRTLRIDTAAFEDEDRCDCECCGCQSR